METNLTKLTVCPHCGLVSTAGNIARWHGDRCLFVSPEGHKGQNSYLNKSAIYIDLSTERVLWFGSFRDAAKQFNVKNYSQFGQVIKGNKGSYANQLVLKLHDFLRADEDELQDLLSNARVRRRRGYRPPKNQPMSNK